MTIRPILFSGPMVRALLEGRKTQTRRVLCKHDDDREPPYLGGPFEDDRASVCAVWCDPHDSSVWRFPGLRGATGGDLLWVRETWAQTSVAPIVETIEHPWIVYRAADNRTDYGGPWRPSIFMPRSASRLTLRVTDVRVQRVQAISQEDAIAEGCPGRLGPNPDFPDEWDPSPVEEFAALWDSLNARRGYGWDTNPWVVALTFEVVAANVSTLHDREVSP